jgi:hypothetical protein
MTAPVGACLFAFSASLLGTTGVISAIKSNKFASLLHSFFLIFLPIGFMRDT